VADDLTAIIDLQFGPDGRLYVAQPDDAGLLAFEAEEGVGGSIRACDVTTGDCDVVASGIPILTAIAFRGNEIWHTEWSLVPEAAPPPFSADVVRVGSVVRGDGRGQVLQFTRCVARQDLTPEVEGTDRCANQRVVTAEPFWLA
jgi:hypothetical protein